MRFQMSHRSRNSGFSSSSYAQISTPGINGLEAWKLGASYGPVRSQWRLSAPRFVHHHRHRSYAGARSAQMGPRAFCRGHRACLAR